MTRFELPTTAHEGLRPALSSAAERDTGHGAASVSTSSWLPRFAAGSALGLLTLGLPASIVIASAPPSGPTGSLPQSLAATGLYSDFEARRVAGDALSYTPQYPLWSDGAAKRRWIRLPVGTAIDAHDVDAWEFPVGTQLWKEFSFGGPVETRYMELGPDRRWLYASYVWSADGREARLAPEAGVRGAYRSSAGLRHDVPGRLDCIACHGAASTEVLGFSTLQLSADRDALAPHAERAVSGALDLSLLVGRELVRNLPREHAERPPRIVSDSGIERAALGYLHSNCGHCHNARGPLAALGLELDYLLAEHGSTPNARRTTLDVPARSRGSALSPQLRITGGAPEASLLYHRVTSRNPLVQMPPLGTHAVDDQAAELLAQWIRGALKPATSSAARDSSCSSQPLYQKD